MNKDFHPADAVKVLIDTWWNVNVIEALKQLGRYTF